MDTSGREEAPQRKDDRVILHFDHDCFYAAVFEAANPALKSIPFAVQQKHIIVTCNYEARRRGCYKLQLIAEARRVCPEIVIYLGEDISRFRDASKDLYNFLAPFSWSRRVERLGFDEVWFDVTDTIDYNVHLLNTNDLEHSFFQLAKHDPTDGFAFDARHFAGHTWPAEANAAAAAKQTDPELTLRLLIASHLAIHMRHTLADTKGYTSTVGVATNKLLSKLVGNVNKPNGQTTLLPPYGPSATSDGHAVTFLDDHDIGKIPSIGFKTAQKLREHVLNRDAAFDFGLVYGGTRENVTVKDVRTYPDINAENLEKLLSGPGQPHGIGPKIWALLHGIDTADVSKARKTPQQISIEDSYLRLDTMAELQKEFITLGMSLINRMRIDLVGSAEDDSVFIPKFDYTPEGLPIITEGQGEEDGDGKPVKPTMTKKWLAHPKTLRLTTRPRQPIKADGTRTRSFKRISHSAPLPNFVFSLNENVDALAEKLMKEALLPMFRKLHPEKSGWNLSLVNIGVTNMYETGSDGKDADGRDIGRMFRKQDEVLKDFRIIENNSDEAQSAATKQEGNNSGADSGHEGKQRKGKGKEVLLVNTSDALVERQTSPMMTAYDHDDEAYEYDNDGDYEAADDGLAEQVMEGQRCHVCGLSLPSFALPAHLRFHELGD